MINYSEMLGLDVGNGVTIERLVGREIPVALKPNLENLVQSWESRMASLGPARGTENVNVPYVKAKCLRVLEFLRHSLERDLWLLIYKEHGTTLLYNEARKAILVIAAR